MNIVIYPLEKAVIDGAEVCLGMECSAIEAVIGKGRFAGNRCYYYNNELSVHYNSCKRAEFIEFLGGPEGFLRPVIYGVSAFDVPADDLIELLTQKNAGKIDDSEKDYSYSFLNISVGVYRETKPADIEKMIEEMKADGMPDESICGTEIELERANHWSAIGIGISGYYQK